MDLNLQTVSITVVLGAYFLLGLAFLMHVFFDRALPSPWARGGGAAESPKSKLWGLAVIAIILAVFFMVGMLLEDVSNKFVDTGDAPWSWMPCLPSEEDLRVEALFGDDLAKSSFPLGRDWARAGLLRQYGGVGGGEVEDAVVARRWSALAANLDGVCEVASSAYYRAKNTVYREPSYFEELKQIQQRIDFARSLAILTLLLVVASILLVILRLLSAGRPLTRLRQLWALTMNDPPASSSEEGTPPAHEQRRRAALRWGVTLVFFVGIYLFACFAYAREEIEFNRRAYGYFLTMESEGSPAPEAGIPADISGIAPLGPRTLLVVHDTKIDRPLAPRVGILGVDGTDADPIVTYGSVDVGWGPSKEPSNDLEAACAVPGRDREFLLAESRPSNGGSPGRLFHLEVEKEKDGPWRGVVRRTFTLPAASGKSLLDQIEGLACVGNGEGRIRVYLCERGSHGRPARLRWTTISSDPGSDGGQLVLPEEAQLELPLIPGGWHDSSRVRTCSDLYLDPARRLWISAAEDPDDKGGPFRSVIYEAGILPADGGTPELAGRREVARLDGLKVEALGPGILSSADLSVATDDEAYGGVWRPIWVARDQDD